MPKRKAKFSVEDEKEIINFVKSHNILYNKKNKRFRDSIAKNRLWLQLANGLDMDVEVVKKKWQTMRDYFVRCRESKTTGSEALKSRSTKWDESLSFLLQSSNNYSISSLAAVGEPSTNQEEQNLQSQDDDSDETNSNAGELHCFNGSVSQTPNPKKRSISPISESDTNEIIREFSVRQPKPEPIDFVTESSNDDVQKFFLAMASTVRKFSPVTRARIKLKIGQIVGQQEIAWAERETAVECIYLDTQGEEQKTARIKQNFKYST